MSGKAFLDTNLFVYMHSASEAAKKELSFKALENFDCVVSTQVINEFCNVALKKLAMTAGQALQVLHAISCTCEIAVVGLNTAEKALGLKEKYGFGFYDSLIVASALESGCTYLFSEDMSDGQVIEGGLEIVNVFARTSFLNNDEQ